MENCRHSSSQKVRGCWWYYLYGVLPIHRLKFSYSWIQSESRLPIQGPKRINNESHPCTPPHLSSFTNRSLVQIRELVAFLLKRVVNVMLQIMERTSDWVLFASTRFIWPCGCLKTTQGWFLVQLHLLVTDARFAPIYHIMLYAFICHGHNSLSLKRPSAFAIAVVTMFYAIASHKQFHGTYRMYFYRFKRWSCFGKYETARWSCLITYTHLRDNVWESEDVCSSNALCFSQLFIHCIHTVASLGGPFNMHSSKIPSLVPFWFPIELSMAVFHRRNFVDLKRNWNMG